MSVVTKTKPKAVKAAAFTARLYDATRIRLREVNGKPVSRIPVLPEGQFKHPWYGDLNFNASILRAMKRNFDNKVLGIDIMVDEGHDRGKAMGWYKSVQHGTRKFSGRQFTGLTATIEWTDLGVQYLERGIYKYFSAEVGTFVRNTDNGEVNNVLFGGGLTNRPFFKQMPAVKLEEAGGTLENRFSIGVFADDQWMFSEETSSDEEDNDETPRLFFAGFNPHTEDEDDEEEEDDSEEEDTEVKFTDLVGRLNAKFDLDLDEANPDGVVNALGNAIRNSGRFAALKEELGKLGFSFSDDKSVVATLVTAFTEQKEKIDGHNEELEKLNKKLSDQEAAAAVDPLVEKGLISQAKRGDYMTLFHTNHSLFESLTKDLKPAIELGEQGGDGDPDEPGAGKSFEDKFKPGEEATQKEADRYLELAGRKKEK